MQYYILSQNTKFAEILTWLDQHGCWYEVHLNRTRFKIEPGKLLTEFMLMYSTYIDQVEDW